MLETTTEVTVENDAVVFSISVSGMNMKLAATDEKLQFEIARQVGKIVAARVMQYFEETTNG